MPETEAFWKDFLFMKLFIFLDDCAFSRHCSLLTLAEGRRNMIDRAVNVDYYSYKYPHS
jgi:hypothetical protein